jgi:hypothetical protein
VYVNIIGMNADTLIEEIQKLPPEDIQKVGTFVDGLLSDMEADRLSANRAEELASGAVKPLSHADVFGHTLSAE